MSIRITARERCAGFTVLEMLVALVVVAIVAAIAWPRVTAPSPSLSVRTAALRLAAEFRSARADAMTSGMARAVTIDLTRRTFWTGADGAKRRIAAPLRLQAEGPLAWAAPQQAQVLFRPDGSSSGGSLRLSAGTMRASVHVDWLTGATSVSRGR